MTDFILLAVLAVIIGAAARYVYQAKKRGATCIGCSVCEGGCHCHAAEAAASPCSCGCPADTKK